MYPFSDGCKFITAMEFAELIPLNLYHLESEKFEYTHPDELKNRHIRIRHRFRLDKGASEKVSIRFSADDYAKIYINGSLASQGPAPGYEFNYRWCDTDISGFLCDGENVIEAEVYYQGLVNRVWNSGDLRFGFICEIYSDSGVIASTDESWEYVTESCFSVRKVIGYETQFVEDCDSRIKNEDYRKCFVRKNTDYVFAKKPTVPLSVYSVEPVEISRLENGGVFCDFGKEITGTLILRAEGKSGDRVRILCGEETDGSEEKVRYRMRCNCEYEQLWTLADGECEWREFDYKAFRYVALIPQDEAEVSFTEIGATVRHYPMNDEACTLETENGILREVFELCKHGVRLGSQEVYVDCPSREKGQYAGDLTVTSASQIYLSGDISLFEKAVEDQMCSANICPGLMAVTPGSYMQEIADYSLQFPILALRHYSFTGDKEFLSKTLGICRGIVTYFEKYARPDGLLDGVSGKWNLVDWPENMRDGYAFKITKPTVKGCHNVVNAFYVGCVLQTEQICEILGVEHEGKGKELAQAFNRTFYDSESGLYRDFEGSDHSALHSNVLPLYYGFIPRGSEKRLCDFIMEKGLVCGVYFSYFLLKALCRGGREKDAFSLIVSEGESSWYNMVREGGTACFEAWGKDKKWNASLCHPWASSPISVLIEDILPLHPEYGKINTKIKRRFIL